MTYLSDARRARDGSIEMKRIIAILALVFTTAVLTACPPRPPESPESPRRGPWTDTCAEVEPGESDESGEPSETEEAKVCPEKRETD